ncbi:MAG: hypothetical protein IJJ69_04425 [Oscillospiraceae bacterium]|nr:hypothetical protein [Oscillospiraceae bacterium]
MEQTKTKKIALVTSISVLAVIGTMIAFLTSTDTADNQFAIGKVNLKIEEVFEENQKLSAGQIITKQPWVKNTGTVNELFFAEIYVPCMEATFLDSDGQRIPPDNSTLSVPPEASEYLQIQEIYNLIADGTPKIAYITEPEKINNDITKNWQFSYNTNTDTSSGWVYLTDTTFPVMKKSINKVQGMMDGIYDIYLLGYSAWVAPQKKTVPIFDKLQLRSIIDADIKGDTLAQVQINAYTIQADDLNLSNLQGDGTADNPYTADDLKKIYAIIQNKESTP